MKILASSPIILWQIDGENMETVLDFIFSVSKINVDGDCSHKIKRCLLLRRKAMTNLDSLLQSRDITLLTKLCIVKSHGFSSSHVWMWELDHKEGWGPGPKNWCFWTVVLEKTLQSPLDCKEIQPVHPKGNQPWIFTGRTDAKAFVWITTNWNILNEMEIPGHITCLLRNLYAGQEATVRTRHGTMDWFKIGKGVCQGCILSLCLFNFYAEYIMWNAGLDESQAGIKIPGRNINNLRFADDTI